MRCRRASIVSFVVLVWFMAFLFGFCPKPPWRGRCAAGRARAKPAEPGRCAPRDGPLRCTTRQWHRMRMSRRPGLLPREAGLTTEAARCLQAVPVCTPLHRDRQLGEGRGALGEPIGPKSAGRFQWHRKVWGADDRFPLSSMSILTRRADSDSEPLAAICLLPSWSDEPRTIWKRGFAGGVNCIPRDPIPRP